MNYTLNQLLIYQKVVETRSITKASEELNLTQPAVSIQIRNFQQQFDIPLIEIIGKRIFVTEFGYEIAKSAEEIIQQIQHINYQSSAFKGLLIGTLKISVVSTAKYVLPYFLADFIKLHPDVDLKIEVSNREQVLKSQQENEVDFSMVSLHFDTLSYEYIPLFKNELYLVGNPENAKHFPDLNKNFNFDQLPLIFREEGSGTRRVMEKFLNDHQIKVKKKLELTSNEAVKQAVIAGLGYSIMPLIGIKNEIEFGKLCIIPQKNLPISTDWMFLWQREKKLSPVATAFLTYLRSNASAIVQKNFLT
ncbi:MAG: hypothetical protein RJA76_160 [Bacteroidota bacterium]|jgi:DNA-binding transcriptional LysR family regulator